MHERIEEMRLDAPYGKVGCVGIHTYMHTYVMHDRANLALLAVIFCVVTGLPSTGMSSLIFSDL